MEVFQNLNIFVPDGIESNFIEKLLDNITKSEWNHKSDFESNYQKNTASEDKIVICIETPNLLFNDVTLKAYVWFRKEEDHFEVFNIVPAKSGSLSFNQYNFILNKFYELFITNLREVFNLKIVFSKPNKSIIDFIGEDAADILIRFSRSANKSTGNTNPYDFNRWCDFVFILYRKEIHLSIGDFERWLIEEEGWSDDMASKLGLDLEYALDILEKYEHN